MRTFFVFIFFRLFVFVDFVFVNLSKHSYMMQQPTPFFLTTFSPDLVATLRPWFIASDEPVHFLPPSIAPTKHAEYTNHLVVSHTFLFILRVLYFHSIRYKARYHVHSKEVNIKHEPTSLPAELSTAVNDGYTGTVDVPLISPLLIHRTPRPLSEHLLAYIGSVGQTRSSPPSRSPPLYFLIFDYYYFFYYF
jgi:hypothetical protein